MARRSLKPQLNQIRSWVRQGRTDAWIAHQLEVSVRDLSAFKREHDLAPAEEAEPEGAAPREEVEVDLRAEDDALVAAALDAEPEETDVEDAGPAAEAPSGRVTAEEGEEDEDRPRRRRGRRGGRGRRSGAAGTRREAGEPLEGTFDHGEEGYGLWLDPAVQDDAVYAEHWAGHRPVAVVVEPDQIVIRRADEAAHAPVASEDGDDGG
ncbi:MAG: hypothetical protein M3088_06150 [Actinomycetota bacterium]|nr:hypothetical protein [Actinomycetota bacterium]